MSRCILESMSKGAKKLFTVPVELEELAGVHAAAHVLGIRNATGMVYQFMRTKINEAKALNLAEYEIVFKTELARVMSRSKQKVKERSGVPTRTAKASKSIKKRA